MRRIYVFTAILTALMVAWAILAYSMPYINPSRRIVEDFSGVPLKVEGWEGTNMPPKISDLRILSTASILSRIYTNDMGDQAWVSVLFGLDLGDFHQPEVCLKGTGLTVTGSKFVTIRPKGMPAHKAAMLTLTHERGEGEGVMLYWFYIAGQSVPVMGGSKVKALWDQMFGSGIQPSAKVMVQMFPIYDRETAEKQAIDLAEKLEPSVYKVLSKKPRYEPSDALIKRLENEQNQDE